MKEMESLCIKLRKIIVVAMEDKLLDTGIDFLDEGYARHEDKYNEIQLQKKQKSPIEEACDMSDMSTLLRESHHLIMQWLILLCVRQCNESSMESLALPRDVDKWLDSIVDSDIPDPTKKEEPKAQLVPGVKTGVATPTNASESETKGKTTIKELEVYMKTWLANPANANNLMPSSAQKDQIVLETGIEKNRLEGWFYRARQKLKKVEALNQGQSSTTNESKQSNIPNGERNSDNDIEKQQKYNSKASSNKHPQSSLQLELLPITQDSDNVHYLQVATGKEGVEYPINTQDIVALTKHIILPKKMEVQEGVDVLPHDMTDLQVYKSGEVLRESHIKLGIAELTQIAREAINISQQIQQDIDKAKVLTHGTKADLDEIECGNLSVIDNIDSLYQCDVDCELAMEKLADVIHQLFKLTCFVGWVPKYANQLITSFRDLLIQYSTALDTLTEGVLKLHDKSGYEDFHELTRTKVTVLMGLLDDFSNINKASQGPSPLSVPSVLQAYRQHFVRNSAENIPDESNEALFLPLIHARIKMAMKTIHNPSSAEILSNINECEREIEDLSKRIRDVVTIPKHLWPTDTKLLEEYESNQSIYAVLVAKERISPSKLGTKDMLKILLQKTTHLTMQLLAVSSSRQRSESFLFPLALPPRLSVWLNTAPGDVKRCNGHGSAYRVSSVFSSLIYRWLEARCAEWHAELTRDELLQSMEEVNDSVKAVSPRKGGRKSKKKKKKTLLNRGDMAGEIVSSPVADRDQQKANLNDDTSSIPDDDQQKNDTICSKEEGDNMTINKEDTTTSNNNEQITSSPTKSVDSSLVLNSSSGNMTEEKQHEDINLCESSDYQVEPSQPTHKEVDVENGIEKHDQNVITPTNLDQDLPDEDPFGDRYRVRSDTVHEQVDTREDILSYLTSIRSKLKEEIIGNIDETDTLSSINQHVRTIQALLTSNEEIYDRCRGHIESGTDEKTMFTKANHTVVDAHHDEVTSMFQFVTYPEHCRLEFDTIPLSSVPFSLDFGVYSCRQRFKGDTNTWESSFIDYTALFESLIMLHPDIQGPFLAKLKDHLETVHTCLTKIDNWISTPSSNMQYLQQTFGEEKLQVSNKTIKHFCIEGSHQDDEICFQCEGRFDQHNVEERQVNGIEGGHRRLCSHPEDKDLPYFMCSKCDADSDIQCLHYQVEESYVLREFNCNKFDTTFNISEAKGRLQLEKFIGFIESIAE